MTRSFTSAKQGFVKGCSKLLNIENSGMKVKKGQTLIFRVHLKSLNVKKSVKSQTFDQFMNTSF